MATNNALDNTSAPFTVTSGGLTVDTGATTLTPIASGSATGLVTVSNAGVLSKVDTGASGTILVGTATSPKFLAAGTSTYVLQTNGAGSDPSWVVGGGGGPITGQTQYAVEVGAAGGGIQSLSAVGATGECLVGNTGADPSWTDSPTFSGTWTAGTFSVDILNLPPTTATQGQITIGGDRFMHSYSNLLATTFLGTNAGNFTLTGGANTGIGYQSLTSLTTGWRNQACGSNSLASLTTGRDNSSLGAESMALATTANYNSAIGYQALGQLIRGWGNIAIGYQAGYNYLNNERSNICIGYGVLGTTGESNVLRIGNGTGTGDGQLNAAFISGIYGITVTGSAVYVSSSDQLGVLASSSRFKENIQDMGDDSSKLKDLRPVTFNYKLDETKSAQYGLIAEEVEALYPELVSYDKEGKPFSVHYHLLPAMLLNEFQKLSKEMKILEAELEKKCQTKD